MTVKFGMFGIFGFKSHLRCSSPCDKAASRALTSRFEGGRRRAAEHARLGLCGVAVLSSKLRVGFGWGRVVVCCLGYSFCSSLLRDWLGVGCAERTQGFGV